MHRTVFGITLLLTLLTTSTASSAQPRCLPHEGRATVVFDAVNVRWERCAQPSFDVDLYVDANIADGTLLPVDVDFDPLRMSMHLEDASLEPTPITQPTPAVTLGQAWQADTRWHICGAAVDGQCRADAKRQSQRAPATALLHAAAYVGMSLLSPHTISRLSDAAVR